MFKSWREFLEKHRTAPEESVLYRVAVTVLVMFALLLTLHQLEWPSYWPAVLVITPAASVLSYYRRGHSNVWLKIFLSFAMVALLLWFFTRLSQTLYDPRLPLAELLVWLQALHAFDLPAKKDLRYTGLVALILMAIACVLTYSSNFAPLLLLFCVLFLVVLAIDFWAGNRTPQTKVYRASGALHFDPTWLWKTVAKALPPALLGAAVIFLFMPRYQGLTLRSMPVNWDIQFSLSQVSSGDIVNESTQRTNIETGGRPQKLEGDSYFGIDSEVNLNARGKLSDRVVLKVRTSNWQYHRGATFGTYTGFGWKALPWKPESRKVRKPPFLFPSVNWQDERVTIYYAETDLPNIIFTPSTPSRLYFPSNEIFQLPSFRQRSLPKDHVNTPATLVSPFLLEKGVVYSTLNQVPAMGPSQLSKQLSEAGSLANEKYLQPFLQLPGTVTERTRAKARELTRGKKSDWARAAALTSYLQQNFKYNLEVDFYPESADTVDHFLFEEKEGYCEQFATSLCVLARAAGLPSRYVTGYLPGTFNPVSGFYEIKASDAHAWAEIYFQGYGWMIFDPVPGENATPQVGNPPQQRWLLEALLDYFQVPSEIRDAVPNLLRVAVTLAIVSLLIALIRRERTVGRAPLSRLARYLNEAERLTQPRKQGETVLNWTKRLSQHPELLPLAQVYEETFYQDKEPETAQLDELERLLRALKKKSKKKL